MPYMLSTERTNHRAEDTTASQCLTHAGSEDSLWHGTRHSHQISPTEQGNPPEEPATAPVAAARAASRRSIASHVPSPTNRSSAVNADSDRAARVHQWLKHPNQLRAGYMDLCELLLRLEELTASVGDAYTRDWPVSARGRRVCISVRTPSARGRLEPSVGRDIHSATCSR